MSKPSLDLPKIHPRLRVVDAARNEIARVVARQPVTTVEVLTILAGMQSDYARDLLRLERHGTSDKKADEQ